jgi:hypothetical protein
VDKATGQAPTNKQECEQKVLQEKESRHSFMQDTTHVRKQKEWAKGWETLGISRRDKQRWKRHLKVMAAGSINMSLEMRERRRMLSLGREKIVRS